MRETKQWLIFLEKSLNWVKAKIVKNITNMHEQRKLLFRERTKPHSIVSRDGHDKPFCNKVMTMIDNFKKALGDTDNW